MTNSKDPGFNPESPIPLGGYVPNLQHSAPKLPEPTVSPKYDRDVNNPDGLGCFISLAAVGFLAFAASCMYPQYPGSRLVVKEHLPVSWMVDDCEPGWTAKPADPIKLAKGLRVVSEYIHKEQTAIEAAEAAGSVDSLSYDDPGYERQQALNSADIHLDYSSDEPNEVACQLPDSEDFVVKQDAIDILKDIETAGYRVDRLTGEVQTP